MSFLFSVWQLRLQYISICVYTYEVAKNSAYLVAEGRDFFLEGLDELFVFVDDFVLGFNLSDSLP